MFFVGKTHLIRDMYVHCKCKQITDLVPPTVDDVADVEAKEESYQLGDCPVVGVQVFQAHLCKLSTA